MELVNVAEHGRQIWIRHAGGNVVSFPDTNMAERPQSDMTANALVECIPNDGQEHTLVVAYTSRMDPLAWGLIAAGGVDSTMFAPREVLGWALCIPRARYVGVAHNHPSGGVSPSIQDVQVTQVLAGVGKALGIDIVYSLVVTHESDEWAEIPLEGARAPKAPGDDEGQPSTENPDDPTEDPKGERFPQDPGGLEEDDPTAGPEGGDEGDEGEPMEPMDGPVDYGEQGTANMDELKAAVSRLLKGGK